MKIFPVTVKRGGGGAAGNVKIGPDYGSIGHSVAVALAMPATAFRYTALPVTTTYTMPATKFAYNAMTQSTALAGTYLGAPLWKDIGVVASSVNGTSVVIPKPAGLVVGELMVAVVASSVLSTTALPSGWTQIRNTQRDGAVLDCTLNSSWKIADASDVAASSFTFTLSASAGFTGCIHRIAAPHATTPIHISAEGSGSAADPVAPTATTTAANCLILIACVQAQATDESFAPPANYIERSDQTGLGVAGAHVIDSSTATRPQNAAGATGAQTFNSTATLAMEYAAQTVCIAPGVFTLS